MRRFPFAPVILALLLAEAMAAPVEEFVSLLAEAPLVRILPGAVRDRSILDSIKADR